MDVLLHRDWTRLCDIGLSSLAGTQGIVALMIMVQNFWAIWNGPISKGYFWVEKLLFREKQYYISGSQNTVSEACDARLTIQKDEAPLPKCIFDYLGYNNIGNQGAKLLVKAELPLLQVLWLSKFIKKLGEWKFGNEGARQLAKGEWPQLLDIDIGNCAINLGGNRSKKDGYSAITTNNWNQLRSLNGCSE